ncbi:hypothetical protein LshimejAT787_0102630 [Lyophyllum shimeji]|uniref:Uncharacterized protein n=1 Tax=Lyophyllum shimeji TaxID=47721 RepID=A0A9P3PD02_LYOSH|nr:hypothetical protein LshimejAT787_0102630 [Lyophyllum shimeji]
MAINVLLHDMIYWQLHFATFLWPFVRDGPPTNHSAGVKNLPIILFAVPHFCDADLWISPVGLAVELTKQSLNAAMTYPSFTDYPATAHLLSHAQQSANCIHGAESRAAPDVPSWTVLQDSVDNGEAESDVDELAENRETIVLASESTRTPRCTRTQSDAKYKRRKEARPVGNIIIRGPLKHSRSPSATTTNNVSETVGPSSETYSTPPTSTASHCTTLERKTESQPFTRSVPRSQFLGVVITRPPARRTKTSRTDGEIECPEVVEASEADLVEALTAAFKHNSGVEGEISMVLRDPPVLKETASTLQSSVSIVDTELEPDAQPVDEVQVTYARQGRGVPARFRKILREDEIEDLFEAAVGEVRFEDKQRRPPSAEHNAMWMNLRHLLESRRADESQRGMPGPAPGGDGARSSAIAAKSRADQFIELSEEIFGPGYAHRGNGRKPNKIGKAPTPDSDANGTSHEGSVDLEERGYINPYVHRGVSSKRRSDDAAGGRHKRPKLEDNSVPSSVDEAVAEEWVVMMQPLIKGKVGLDDERLRGLSDLLRTIDGLKHRVSEHVLEATRLRQSVTQLSELEDVPFGDEHGLQDQARALRDFWSTG